MSWTPTLFGIFFYSFLAVVVIAGALTLTLTLGRALRLWEWDEDDITDEMNRAWAERRGLLRD